MRSVAQMVSFFETDKYQLYHLLDDRYLEVKKWIERERYKEAKIREYVYNNPDTNLIKIIDLCYELQQIGKLEYEINESIRIAFSCVFDDKELFLNAVKYYLTKWSFNDVLYNHK